MFPLHQRGVISCPLRGQDSNLHLLVNSQLFCH